MEKITEIAKTILMRNMNLSDGENILIVCDTGMKEIADLFYRAGTALRHETVLMVMEPRSRSGEEPPETVAEAMKRADVVLCITQHSLTHTNARKKASEAGARVATMPGITVDMFSEGAITADCSEIERLTDHFCRILDQGSEVKIIKGQTRLTFSIEGRKSLKSTGIFRKRGESGNLPSGESYIAPLEDSANGTILVDGSIAGVGVLSRPITLSIKNGKLEGASGPEGKKLMELLGPGKGRILAEFGIGTNKKARLSGNVLEDEKVFGTVHIAFGSNKPFGGTNEAGVHIDCVILNPEVWVDDQKLVLK
ncbi:aminopeptidase [Caldibacillus debilis]|uniref:aminopeptidase n=1 Tax=Caldibacillus debilis TaxID=301148 RepID=UPI002FDA9710